jgi:Flp pilus assembly protein TadD
MMHRQTRERQSAAERARVAAELLHEAELLTETAMLLPVAPPVVPAPITPVVATPPAARTAPRLPPSMVERKNGTPVIAPESTTLARFDAAIGERPDDIHLRLDRAELLSQTGRYAAARCDLEYVLAVEPENLAALSALGVVFLRKGLWAEAVPRFQRVVELDGHTPTPWLHLAEALNHVDDLPGALAAFRRAEEIDPTNARALYGQGVVLDRMRRPDDATRMYRRSREVARR